MEEGPDGTIDICFDNIPVFLVKASSKFIKAWILEFALLIDDIYIHIWVHLLCELACGV